MNRTAFSHYFSSSTSYLRNLSNYLTYTYKDMTHELTAVITKPVSKQWVSLEGFTKSGEVAIRIYDSTKGIYTVTAELADLEIQDIYGSAKIVKKYLKQQAEAHYYEYEKNGKNHKCVVIWLEDGRPLNLVLIENRVATPTITPPTNIVYSLFRTYYRGLL